MDELPIHPTSKLKMSEKTFSHAQALSETLVVQKGLVKIQSAEAGPSGVGLIAKLAGHPKFGPKLGDPAFMRKLQMAQSNPQLLMSDPEMMEVLQVILGGMGGGEGEGEDAGDNNFTPPPQRSSAPPKNPEPVLSEEKQNIKDILDKSIVTKDGGNVFCENKQFAEAQEADPTNLMVINNAIAHSKVDPEIQRILSEPSVASYNSVQIVAHEVVTEQGGEFLLDRAMRFAEEDKLCRALMDLHDARDCVLSAADTTRLNELHEYLMQRRYVSTQPLYRAYKSHDDPSALLSFASGEIGSCLDKPFFCDIDENLRPLGISLQDFTLNHSTDTLVERALPAKEDWSADTAGIYSTTDYEASWIAKDMETSGVLCNRPKSKEKNKKQWDQIFTYHWAEIPTGTVFPSEFWIETDDVGGPGHYTLYSKPYQTSAVAQKRERNQQGCAELSALAVHRPPCVIVRTCGELPSVRGGGADSSDQRCVHQAIKQLNSIDNLMRAVDLERFVDLRAVAVECDYLLDLAHLEKLFKITYTVLDDAPAPTAMDIFDNLPALRAMLESKIASEVCTPGYNGGITVTTPIDEFS